MKIIYLAKWLLVLAVGTPLLVYAILILLNLDDEAKSSKVIEFERFLTKRATIDDKNNGFVYVAGLSAKAGDDFYSIGLERITQANRTTSSSTALPKQEHLNISTMNMTFEELVAGCGNPIQFNLSCNTYLHSKAKEIDMFLSDSNVLLQRYEIMTRQSDWYESIQDNPYNGLSLSPWSFAHNIYMLNIWQLTVKGQMETATKLLEQDSVFLRKAMTSTHSLLNLMVASSLMQQHYRWGAFTLSNFSTDDSQQYIPSDWRQPLFESSFSLNNIIIGEWHFASTMFRELHKSNDWLSFFSKPLFNLQSTLNLYADTLIHSAQLKQEKAKDTFISDCKLNLNFSSLGWYSYNPIGKLLACVGYPSLGYYRNELNKTEKSRLAALNELQGD